MGRIDINGSRGVALSRKSFTFNRGIPAVPKISETIQLHFLSTTGQLTYNDSYMHGFLLPGIHSFNVVGQSFSLERSTIRR